MLKVSIFPQFRHEDHADGGIRRVVEAMNRYLPDFGVQVVDDQREADIVACHGTETSNRTDVPIVAHCHGLYWERYNWDPWAYDVNRQVVESLARAVAHTAPSVWVSDAMRRGMYIYPEVVYHGVNVADWMPSANPGNYILWNKARADNVSNPDDLNKIARKMPNYKFVSTFGNDAPNVKIVGSMPYGEMNKLVCNAGVYLATARETFGIGTLEALAAGVPVAGWDYGGQSEIIIPGETGYLAPYGDYDALANAIALCLKERSRLGKSARHDVAERWRWQDRIQQYAELYKRTAAWWGGMKPKVSVIVTCYNLERFLDEALGSVSTQTMSDWECVVVDDCSTDNSAAKIKAWEAKDARFRYVKTPRNSGLCGARNYGVQHSHGRNIIMLDADDMLANNALEVLSTELDRDVSIHIAAGHLDVVSDDGSNRYRPQEWPFREFNWFGQMAHLNQIPYASMMRREVFERAGGYRSRQWRAEDAEFWCRATTFGFRARKVTEASVLIYRNRANSKSKGEPGDGDWCAWFPWSLAHKAGEIHPSKATNALAKVNATPFGAQGSLPEPKFWPVKDFSAPAISVIIPVGPGHEMYVIDALDSLMAQTYRNWEAIVVNDTGKEWRNEYPNPVSGAPYAKVLYTGKVPTGAGHARNFGAQHAKADILLWLDADDYLMPNALEEMLYAYTHGEPAVIYADWFKNDGSGSMEVNNAEDFACGRVLEQMQHSVTCLVPRASHDKIGGFDESMTGWEDWEYFIALQTTGLGSCRVNMPLMVYRFNAGKRRQKAWEEKDKNWNYIRTKWSDYYKGDKVMACGGGCGGRSRRTDPPPAVSQQQQQTAQAGSTLLRYLGSTTQTIHSKVVASVSYKFGSDEGHRERFVYDGDVDRLLSFRVGGKPLFEKVE